MSEPNPKCCCKGCDNRVEPPNVACAACCALLDRLLGEEAKRQGRDPDELIATIEANCVAAARRIN